ncbi:MAG: gliding motility-associated C-terminal domain-containing protein [Candidatus Latescibacteria bacterium]|nr:gliding motility-associated C-terminal domain-containing protein [Candidatus Latescibacterota bacterium]
MRGDSLLITLPEPVSRDSVEVEFTARFLRNATVVSLDLGHSGRPGLWQSVEAAERQANVVFLPDLASRRRLIGDLEIAPHVLTPNGDGLNEAVEIRFAIFKVERPQAQVLIFDLAGRLVAELPPDAGRDVQVFRWSGRNQGGELVEPGIYLCHIAVGAKAGKDVAIEPIAVAY